MNLILQLLIIIHIGIWLFVLFGGFFKESYAKFNIIILIPFIYVIHILPFHMIVETKLRIIENESIHNNNNTPSMKILEDEECKYILPYYFQKLKCIFDNSFCNPLSPQGLLILGFIINVYVMIYKWKTWKN
jgi:hypothetical protein